MATRGTGRTVPLSNLRPWRAPASRILSESFLSIVITALVCYGVGVRGDALFWAVILGVLPTYFVLAFITLRLFPPDAEATGDYRGILYGANRNESGPLATEPAEDEPGKPASPNYVTEAASLEGRKEPRALEGSVLRTAAIALALFAVWSAAQPLVTHVFPEWGATKTGPDSFPLSVHIGSDGVRFTNGSAEHWTCKAGIGVWPRYAPPFVVAAHNSVEVPYFDFQREEGTNDSRSWQRAARDKISVECRERSGITHFWDFR